MKIAIFRALKLGDLLCAVPALRAIRVQYPTAEIILIGMPWAEEFAKHYKKYIDTFISFPGYPSLPEQKPSEEKYNKFIEETRKEHFDLLFQIHGNGKIVNDIMQKIAPKRLIAFSSTSENVKTGEYLIYPENIHEIHRLLALVQFAAIPLQKDYLEFNFTKEDIKHYKTLLNTYRISSPYICIHPGSISSKPYSAKIYAAVADYLFELGYQIVLTGSAHEKSLVADVKKYMHSSVVDLSGKTDLGCLAAVLSKAKLLLSNETGVSHLAVSLNTPSVTIFTSADEKRWAPLDRSIHKVIGKKENTFENTLHAVQEMLLHDSVDRKTERIYSYE